MKTIKFPLYLLVCILMFYSCSTPDDLEVEDTEATELNEEITAKAFTFSGLRTTIDVAVSSKKAISPYIYGVNNDWRQITDGNYSKFADRLEDINYQAIRFPGGWESEYYDWDNNTAPGLSNQPASPGASINTVKNSNPNSISIVVPTVSAMNQPIWSSAWYAAIQDCKATAEKAINNTGASNIRSVEIGNEWWLQWGGGVSRSGKLSKYAQIAKRIAAHIQSKYPNENFKVLVNGDYTVPAEFATIKNVFGNQINNIDGSALHTYAGYNSSSHNIVNLQSKIQSCRDNLGKNYVSLSEWAPSKAYNNNRTYAQGANVLMRQIYEQARSGAEEGAFWPPANTSIPGLGLFNSGMTLEYPTAQIFGDMSRNLRGNSLGVSAQGSVKIAAAEKSNGQIVVYLAGMNTSWTTVKLEFENRIIDRVVSSTMWEPSNSSNTKEAAPMTVTNNPEIFKASRSLQVNVNQNSRYTIVKVILELK